MSPLYLITALQLMALVLADEARSQAAASAAPASDIPEIVVTADHAKLLEIRPTASVFGLDKPLQETPRSATFVSDAALERYGITTIDKLVEISPSSYTGSFYGVPGSLNIRGTLAESYFDGFKRVENRGTYATPIGDASEIEIVRGPPNPIFGAGKVGGLLNFIPKTAKDTGAYIETPTGEIAVTGGDYDKKEVALQGGAPLMLGGLQGGLYGYLDADDSHSFYHGIYPKRQTGEISADVNLPQGWTTAFEGMVYHSDGDVQTPGWNRLTQALIDNGTYVTGRNTTLVDVNGDGRIEANEPGTFPSGGQYAQLTCFFYGCTNPVHQLTTGVGTAHLSPQTVLAGAGDFSRTSTYTAYFNLAKPLAGDSGVKLELFYDDLNNQRFVSYGFPASYQTYVLEARGAYHFALDLFGDAVKTRSLVGLSDRYTDAHLRESFNSGIIALDRRDLYDGPSATDIIASPFQIVDGQQGWPWELDVHSNIRDAGAFFTSDISVFDRLDVIVGARDDAYNVSSNDLGVLPFEQPHAHAAKARGTYTVSVSYKTPWGVIPYYTYDQAAALELDQASDLLPGTIGGGGWLSDSDLSEAGVKFQAPDHALVGSVSAYRQTRTQLVQGPGGASIQGTLSKGVEFELRWLLTRTISLTYAGDLQHTEVKGPDSSFVYITPETQGVAGVDGYGGAYAATMSTLPDRAGDYAYAIIPKAVSSLYATYTSPAHGWGRFGATAGATYVSKTSTLVQDPIVYPAYWLASLSGFYSRGPYTLSLNVDNLLDTRYFTPASDPTYANVAALPGVGRTWRITLKRKL